MTETSPPKPPNAPPPEEPAKVAHRSSIWEIARRRFITGLITIIPALVTIWAVQFLVGILDNLIGAHVRGPVQDILRAVLGVEQVSTNLVNGVTIGVSLILAIVVIILIGVLSRFIFVRRMIRIGEGIVERIPLVRFFYVTPREVLRTLTTTRKSAKRVVMIEYPRKGIWCIAYATSEIRHHPSGRLLVTVFLPTTPNPTSGFLLMVPAEDVLDINMSTEDAVRFIISGGILSPNNMHTTTFVGFERRPNLPPPEPLTTEEAVADEDPSLRQRRKKNPQ